METNKNQEEQKAEAVTAQTAQEKHNEREIKIVGEVSYVISFKGGKYELMYEVDPEIQIIAHSVVKDTLQYILDNDAKKVKKDQIPFEERIKKQQHIHYLQTVINDLAQHLFEINKNRKQDSGLILQ